MKEDIHDNQTGLTLKEYVRLRKQFPQDDPSLSEHEEDPDERECLDRMHGLIQQAIASLERHEDPRPYLHALLAIPVSRTNELQRNGEGGKGIDSRLNTEARKVS